jgi:hypothetical protein
VNASTRRTDPLTFTNGSLTLFVEWNPNEHGTADLKLINTSANTVIDTLTFHSFNGIVIGFSGETAGGWVGLNQLSNYLDHPTYDIAIDFYNRGYDSHYYDVWKHSGTSNFSGPAYYEAVNAVQNRMVANL